ncbi:hypothetical protein AMST5_00829 [freshwater sediment metagenome]|uniref:Uncharacterized protein n=1 Tax=freshwater sediment metagenome TaxID=556182 RepID=A0AA48LYD1_9ZZZZ
MSNNSLAGALKPIGPISRLKSPRMKAVNAWIAAQAGVDSQLVGLTTTFS